MPAVTVSAFSGTRSVADVHARDLERRQHAAGFGMLLMAFSITLPPRLHVEPLGERRLANVARDGRRNRKFVAWKLMPVFQD
jgi:hypothetical protein